MIVIWRPIIIIIIIIRPTVRIGDASIWAVAACYHAPGAGLWAGATCWRGAHGAGARHGMQGFKHGRPGWCGRKGGPLHYINACGLLAFWQTSGKRGEKGRLSKGRLMSLIIEWRPGVRRKMEGAAKNGVVLCAARSKAMKRRANGASWF